MIPAKFQLALWALAIFASLPTEVLQAQETKTAKPATIAEAAKVIDLSTFPMLPGGTPVGTRRLANLSYVAKGDAPAAYAFQKKTLESRGWKEQPNSYVSPQSCSGTFAKDGYTVSVSTNPASGSDAAGMVQVHVKNHGNLDLAKLPVPSDAKPLYAFATTAAYVTGKPVDQTSQAISKLLIAQGWEPYGKAGDALFFKKNAVRLSAWSAVAPAQGGKTIIQLNTELLSADLPAPPAPLDASYADTTKALSMDVNMTYDAMCAFYREALGKAGWEPTTEKPVTADFDQMMIFRNAAKDIAILKMHTVGDKLRATLTHQTEAELAEEMRLAKEEETRRRAEAKRLAEMAETKAAKDLVIVAIALPSGSKGVERTKDRVEFKLDAGKAKAVVTSMRDDLVKAGWKERAAVLESAAGTAVLGLTGGAVVTIDYVDTGVGDAEVTVLTFGAEIAKPKAK